MVAVQKPAIALRDPPAGWCGVDEAGRGPLAGSVLAAAVILNPQRPIVGLNDSKKLSPAKREQLAAQIQASALAYSVAAASVEEIERLNILQATFLAMRRAVQGLSFVPLGAMVDGNRDPKLDMPTQLLIKGDAAISSIAAASILAKTARDHELQQLHVLYPEYGFAQHMGYPTAAHLEALRRLGPCPAHRRTFGPVAQQLLF